MKKQQLLNVLNQAPDSVSLHDAGLLRFEMQNNRISFLIYIGEYHYYVNNFESYVDDIKSQTVLTLTFDGIKDFEGSFVNNFLFEDAEIVSNEEENGIFTMTVRDIEGTGRFAFKYDSFRWDFIGEFSWEALEEWVKNEKNK